jgi:adenylate kinase
MSKGQFILDTDASGVGIGAVLSQVQNNKERVISYGSKKLDKQQQRYSVTRRELLSPLSLG